MATEPAHICASPDHTSVRHGGRTLQPLLVRYALPEDPAELFAPTTFAPEKTTNLWGRKRLTLQADGDLPNRPEVDIHSGIPGKPKAAKMALRDRAKRAWGSNPKPCAVCGAPCGSKRGVCQRTPACKIEYARRKGARESVVGTTPRPQPRNEASAIASIDQGGGRSALVSASASPERPPQTAGGAGTPSRAVGYALRTTGETPVPHLTGKTVATATPGPVLRQVFGSLAVDDSGGVWRRMEPAEAEKVLWTLKNLLKDLESGEGIAAQTGDPGRGQDRTKRSARSASSRRGCAPARTRVRSRLCSSTGARSGSEP